MSREEAIFAMEYYKLHLASTREAIEAFDVAIEALEQEPCEDMKRKIEKEYLFESLCEDLKKLQAENEKLRKTLEQEPKTSWIPVSEKLPEADEYIGNVAKYYLVQTEYGDMLVARYTHSGYWEQIYQLKPIGDEIVAWRPLPEKYKESEG